MKSLLVKDFYCMKTYLKQYLLILVFFLFFAVMMKSPEYMAFMFLMIALMWIMASLSLDESGGFSYELSLPIDRKTVVKAKYALILVFFAVALAVLAAGAVVMLIMGRDVQEWIWTIAAITAVYSLLIEIILPVSFKFGTQRARVAIMAVALIPALLAVFATKLVSRLGINLDWISDINPTAVAIGMLVFCVAAFLVSYAISKNVFLKKEF